MAEVKVGFSAAVKKGDVLFTLDSSKQRRGSRDRQAQGYRGRRLRAGGAEADVVKAEAQIQEAKANYQQAKDELDVKSELAAPQSRHRAAARHRKVAGAGRSASGRGRCGDRRAASRRRCRSRRSFRRKKASAEAVLAQAQVDLDKTVVRAGVDGRVEQFLVRPGDVVNQLMRPAGILIPEGAGRAASFRLASVRSRRR